MAEKQEGVGMLYSRSGNTNPFGKCTEEAKCMIDEQTKEALQFLAFGTGISLSEYIRHELQCHVHGHASMVKHAMHNGTAGIRP